MNLNFNSIEVSPITGNKCVFEEDGTYICMESGYQHNQGCLDGSDMAIEYEDISPKIIRDTRFVDDGNRVWYKTIAIASNAVLYPDVNDVWKVTTLRKIEEGDEVNPMMILIVGNDQMCLDLEHELVFEKLEFENAMDCFYKLVNNE